MQNAAETMRSRTLKFVMSSGVQINGEFPKITMGMGKTDMAVLAQWHKSATIDAAVAGSIPTRTKCLNIRFPGSLCSLCYKQYTA